jgi:hypothetical protein
MTRTTDSIGSLFPRSDEDERDQAIMPAGAVLKCFFSLICRGKHYYDTRKHWTEDPPFAVKVPANISLEAHISTMINHTRHRVSVTFLVGRYHARGKVGLAMS